MLANELVPGDIVKFSTGDRVPADIRFINVRKMRKKGKKRIFFLEIDGFEIAKCFY